METCFIQIANAKSALQLSAGEYVVSVTASNLLGNLTTSLPQLFYVQVAPSGLKLDKSEYSIGFDKPLTFFAVISAGTAVSFDWDMGDQTTKENAGTPRSFKYVL